MSETLCQRCWEPLPEGAGNCTRCGAPRPATPRTPVITPATARRLALLAGVLALALAALAVPLVLQDRRAPEPPGDAGPIATEAGGPVGLRAVADSELPETAHCMIDDQPLPASRCARWVLRADGDSFTHLASHGEIVVAALHDGVVRLDPTTGEVRWQWRNTQIRSPRVPAADLLVTGDRVIVVLEADHRIVALDLERGTQVWDAPIMGQAWIAAAPQGEAGTTVLAVHEPTSLSVRSLHDGQVRWRLPMRPGGTAPVIAGGTVVIPDGDALSALDLDDGAHVWTPALTLEPETLLAAAGGQVIVAMPGGSVTGIDASTGRIRWTAHMRGLKQLVSAGGDMLAGVTGSGLHLFGPDGTVPELALATQFVSHAMPAGPGGVLVRIGNSLQRLHPEMGGETWTLQGDASVRTGSALFVGEPAGPLVLATLGGSLLAAFDAPLPAPIEVAGCEGAQATEAMGGLDGWRGERVLVAVIPHGASMYQVLVGVPGEPGTRRFTVRAHRADDPRFSAVFAHSPDEVMWQTELEVRDGGRSSAGWPTHWSLMAQMQPGCWIFQIDGDRVPAVIPVPPPSPPPATQE